MFSIVIEGALAIVGLLFFMPCVMLFTECMSAVMTSRPRHIDQKGPRPSVTVLMPAHNEAAVIEQTLLALRGELGLKDRVMVVADNCGDQTSAIARKAGAVVVDRQNRCRKGKGYALDFGVQKLRDNPPDVVVVVDADCRVQKGTLELLAREAVRSGRPVQAVYRMDQPTSAGRKDAVSALAVLFKNLVRPTGLDRLGLPCHLTGSGMAFPWSVIDKAPLATGNIVEDLRLGIDLAIAGYAPLFCAGARVTGRLPSQKGAAASQRTRWEHGHLKTLLSQAPRLCVAALCQRRLQLAAMAFDLCIPPLALLVVLWTLVTFTAIFAYAVLGMSWTPVVFPVIGGLLIGISVVGGWFKFGRPEVRLSSILAAPAYVVWKIPIYLMFLIDPQSRWVRTERDENEV